MKETTPEDHAQPAQQSPAPVTNTPNQSAEDSTAGGGEMDMEIEDDKGPSANCTEQQNGRWLLYIIVTAF